jgi:uncharacterized alkaline shock family protein YloU
MDEGQSPIGKITVSSEVLETVARLTTLAVPGVARLVSPQGVKRLLGRDGVRLEIVGDDVRVDLYVVTEPDVNMLSIGRRIQAEVTRAIQDIVGMQVLSVDVHIEDVAYTSGNT